MTKPTVTRHFRLYSIESKWSRRAAIVATMPLMIAANIALMLLGVALFWWQNQRELIRSAAHYWRTNQRIEEPESRGAIPAEFVREEVLAAADRPDWLRQLEDMEREHAASDSEGDRQYAAGLREAITAYTLAASQASR